MGGDSTSSAYVKAMRRNRGVALIAFAVAFVVFSGVTAYAITADFSDERAITEFCVGFLKSAYSFSPRNIRERASDAIAMSNESHGRNIASMMERRILEFTENGHAGDGEYIGSILFGKKPCTDFTLNKDGARVTMRASEYVIRPGSGDAYETPVTFVIDIVDVDGKYKVSGCVRKVSGRRVVHKFHPIDDPNGKKLTNSTGARNSSSLP